MADAKISALPSGTTVMGPEVGPFVQTGQTVKLSAAQITAYAVGQLALVAITGDYNDLDNLPTLPVGANPTATAGTSAVNGVATTYMRSDAAPALPQGSSSVKGIVQVDGTTITSASGVISAAIPTVPTAANPTATAGNVAINGAATTFMRSDAAPAIQLGSSSAFGLLKVDGTTINASSGVISANVPTGANPTVTAGATAINGVATTFMRSDAAPAIAQGSSSVKGIVQVDGTTITATAGVISAVQQTLPVGANPTATAGTTAVNGVATTFMRSDAAPALPQGSSSVKGVVQVDGTTITASGGVISAVGGGGPSGANPTATAGDIAVNGVATTFMRSDGAPAIQKGSSSVFGLVKVDGTTITASGGVITAVGGGGGSAIPLKSALIGIGTTVSAVNATGAAINVPCDTASYQDTFPSTDGGPVHRIWYGPNKQMNSVTGNVINLAVAHGFTTGDGPFMLGGSGTMPTGSAIGTRYWAIVVNTTDIRLATSRANALAGTGVTLTGAGSGQRLVATGGAVVTPPTCTRFRVNGQVTLGSVTPSFTIPNQVNFFGYVMWNGLTTQLGIVQQNAVAGGGAPGISFTGPVLPSTGNDVIQLMFGNSGDSSVDITAGLTWLGMEVIAY